MTVLNVDLTAPPGANKAEVDLLKALGRLVRRDPTKKRLKDLRDAGEPLISHANVAEEANRSRTSIGHEKCRYQHLRRRVTDAMAWEAETLKGQDPESDRHSTSREIIRDLRNRNAYLTYEKSALARRVNEAVNVANSMEKKLRRAERAAAKADERARRLQFLLEQGPGRGTVVPFPNGAA